MTSDRDTALSAAAIAFILACFVALGSYLWWLGVPISDDGDNIIWLLALVVLLMPNLLMQHSWPALPYGPRMARRHAMMIFNIMTLFMGAVGFSSAALPLDRESIWWLVLPWLSIGGAVWLWRYLPQMRRNPRMRRVLIKEFGSVIGWALGLAVLFGAMKGWPVPQVIWVWLFMIGLIGNAIMPMTLPPKHGASDLARATLLLGEWMSITAFLTICILLTSSEADPAPALIGAALGIGVWSVIVHYRNKNSGKPPAYTRRF